MIGKQALAMPLCSNMWRVLAGRMFRRLSWVGALKVSAKAVSKYLKEPCLSFCTRFADRLWRLRRDYERSELARQLGVPYDLLEAANRGGLDDLKAGKITSLVTM